MSNIKRMQMWNTICADARISVSKSLFGLRTAAVYIPSNSKIDAKIIGLTLSDGEHVKNILLSSHKDLARAIGDFHAKSVANGNYIAEVCASRDGAFIAILLHQFRSVGYEPVTETHIFEGDDARILKTLFSQS